MSTENTFKLPAGFKVAEGYEGLPTLSQHFQCLDRRPHAQALADLAHAGAMIGAKGAATVFGKGSTSTYQLIDQNPYSRS